ncbi:MAG: hypothetical protein OEM25_00280 [Gammaproteobacteria bacterium]|nr:hypothetical protein [Gammaproteobacteria bacterium]
MAVAAQDLKHYHLPSRIRAGKAPATDFACRLALADRIAGLPGIQTVEEVTDTLPCRVDVYLQAPSISIRRQHDAKLLCSIARDGIHVYGLHEWDRHQVLRGGWGKLNRDHVQIFMPRDHEELEVCWAVLQRAYQCLLHVSAMGPLLRRTLSWELPRFSRTALQ